MNCKTLFLVMILISPAAFGAGSGYIKLEKADFPKTINDVPFEQRVKNQAAGYAPFKDAVAYVPIKAGSEADALQAHLDKLEKQRQIEFLKLGKEEYCKKYPGDAERCTPEQKPEDNTGGAAAAVANAVQTAINAVVTGKNSVAGQTAGTQNSQAAVATNTVVSGINKAQNQSQNAGRAACFVKDTSSAKRFIPPRVAGETVYWWVGDSRFVGMYVNKVIGHKNNEAVVAYGAQGLKWFKSSPMPTGISLLESCLRAGDVVILNLGANDITNHDAYISTYKKLMSHYPNVTFKIVSVNPVYDGKARLKNTQVETFNSHLKNAFPNNYIDTYSILKPRVNANNTDSEGLHYRGGGIEQTVYDTVMQSVK